MRIILFNRLHFIFEIYIPSLPSVEWLHQYFICNPPPPLHTRLPFYNNIVFLNFGYISHSYL